MKFYVLYIRAFMGTVFSKIKTRTETGGIRKLNLARNAMQAKVSRVRISLRVIEVQAHKRAITIYA